MNEMVQFTFKTGGDMFSGSSLIYCEESVTLIRHLLREMKSSSENSITLKDQQLIRAPDKLPYDHYEQGHLDFIEPFTVISDHLIDFPAEDMQSESIL